MADKNKTSGNAKDVKDKTNYDNKQKCKTEATCEGTCSGGECGGSCGECKDTAKGFDFNNLEHLDFNALSNEEKKINFDKLLEQNKGLMEVLKICETQFKELSKKAEGKVSDESYMRLSADFDNYKRRNELSKSTAYADGKVEVLTEFLKVSDNFERAIAMISDKSVADGVRLIQKQYNDILASFKVTEILALNQPFDPNLHNAVMQGEATDKDAVDTVCEVFQKGYTMGDKVLRYAMVKVAK